MLDHLNFADQGIIAQLKAGDRWRLVEKEELEVRKMKEEVEIKKATKQNSIEIAKKFKAMGLDDATIKKDTGLSLVIIKKI